jgi:hypothetical protein
VKGNKVRVLIVAAFLAVALLATVRESRAFAAKRLAYRASQIANDPDHTASHNLAERALRYDPNNFQALHLKAVKSKDLQQFDELESTLARMLIVQPNQASTLRLAGEERFRRADYAAAADYLWTAMWINPTPPSSPAAFWRMTMAASERSGRSEDALKAGLRALALMERDNYLQPRDRRDLLLDVGEMMTRQGWSLAGAYLIAASTAYE